MKDFHEFISEATATSGERRNPTRKQRIDFRNKMMDLKYSDAFDKAEKRKGIGMWNLTGHNPIGRYGTTKEIEAEKERIFGKRRKGTSDLLWIHFKHGLITHPAIGDVVHSDIDQRFGPWGGDAKNRRMKIDKEIQAKVREGGIGALVGHGRVEHHEGGGGIISYHHAGGMSQGAAVRMIARAYPKYMIHDGFGNLIIEDWSSEGMTPEDRKEERRMKSFNENWDGIQRKTLSEAAKPTDLKASVAQAKKVVADADKVMRTLRDRIKSSRAAELQGAGDDPSLHTQRLDDVLGEVEWEYRSLSRMLKQTTGSLVGGLVKQAPMPSWDEVEAAVGRLRKAVLAAKASLKSQG